MYVNEILNMSTEEFDRLETELAKRLDGKDVRTGMMPLISQLETEDRPIKEKIAMAFVAGIVINA